MGLVVSGGDRVVRGRSRADDGLCGAVVRHPAPLFDLGLYRLRSYAVANVASIFFAFAFFGWLVPLPTLIQTVWGWSVLTTGF